ncbi:MAG TPA: zinc ribbon domain-containing protein, partial [Candidatus Lokiarchaeia archaeon]|nr:zinc ribbon domain-containing protein [Candidatus Lokiarchaeia archaeon]
PLAQPVAASPSAVWSDSFDDDQIGVPPSGWNIALGPSASCPVVNSYFGHSKVICLTQTNNNTWDGIDYEGLYVTGNASNGAVTFSCWFLVAEATPDQWFQFMCLNGPNGWSAVDLQIWHNWIAGAVDDGATMTQLLQYQLNSWYSVTAIVNFNTQTYNAWINGTQYIANAPFNHVANNVPFVNIWHITECIQQSSGTGQFYCDSFLVENGTDVPSAQYTSTPVQPVPTNYSPYIIFAVVALIAIVLIGGGVAITKSQHKQPSTVPVTNAQNIPAMPYLNPPPATNPKEHVQEPVNQQRTSKPPLASTRICPRCGLIVESTAKFCEYCGASLETP